MSLADSIKDPEIDCRIAASAIIASPMAVRQGRNNRALLLACVVATWNLVVYRREMDDSYSVSMALFSGVKVATYFKLESRSPVEASRLGKTYISIHYPSLCPCM